MRSGLLVARSPDDPEHERILASSKSNLGPSLPALRYRIAPRTLGTPGSAVPVVEWLGACDYTAAALLADAATGAHGESGPGAGRTSAVDEAAVWRRAQLAAGPHPAAALLTGAKEHGWSEKVLYRARRRLGIDARHVGFGPTSHWVWEAVCCIDGAADPPKTAQPDVHTGTAFFAENGNISGLGPTSPAAFFAENGAGESDAPSTTGPRDTAPQVTTYAMDPEIFPKTAKNAAADGHQERAFLGAVVDAGREAGE